MEEQHKNMLVSLARLAGQACPRLDAIGDMSRGLAGSFTVAQVIRSGDGDIEVELTTGPASLLVGESEAFYS
jgi:hypothetical protein